MNTDKVKGERRGEGWGGGIFGATRIKAKRAEREAAGIIWE
jgi:hypothetical protein